MKTEKTVEVTPWFQCNTKPVHKGWYECDYGKGNDPCMRYWDGETWGMEIEGDMRPVYHFGRELDHSWRGMAKPADPGEHAAAFVGQLIEPEGNPDEAIMGYLDDPDNALYLDDPIPEVDPRQQELALAVDEDDEL